LTRSCRENWLVFVSLKKVTYDTGFFSIFFTFFSIFYNIFGMARPQPMKDLSGRFLPHCYVSCNACQATAACGAELSKQLVDRAISLRLMALGASALAIMRGTSKIFGPKIGSTRQLYHSAAKVSYSQSSPASSSVHEFLLHGHLVSCHLGHFEREHLLSTGTQSARSSATNSSSRIAIPLVTGSLDDSSALAL